MTGNGWNLEAWLELLRKEVADRERMIREIEEYLAK